VDGGQWPAARCPENRGRYSNAQAGV